MSLDVYLYMPTPPTASQSGDGSGIFVRENGSTREIPREEWDAKFLGREPVVVAAEPQDNEVYWSNITHNLGKMADAAGIYYALWRPEEIGITTARQLSELLQDGYSRLLSSPETYRAFDAPNGWGQYDDFVRFVMNYISACEQYPDALVRVSR